MRWGQCAGKITTGNIYAVLLLSGTTIQNYMVKILEIILDRSIVPSIKNHTWDAYRYEVFY